MKVAQVCPTFPPYRGGTGNVCFRYARGLAERGHEVTVFAPADKSGISQDPCGFTVVRHRPLIRAGNAPFIPALSGLRGFDVIHLHCPYFFGDAFARFAAGAGDQPLVTTYHQDVILDGFPDIFSRMYNATVQRHVLRRSDAILVSSMDYFRNSRVFPALGPRIRDIVELPHGVDIDRFRPGVPDNGIRAEYGRNGEALLLFVGGLDSAHYFKGVDVLLRSMVKIPHGKYHLLIVGDGNLRIKYVRMAEDLGISGDVTFCGNVPDTDLPAYYSAADAVILPSTTMGEAFGMVLLEAMASGKPVVASNLPGVRTVADDGRTGFLAAPGNALDLAKKVQDIMADEDLRRRFGRCGREKVERQYNWDEIIRKLETVYTQTRADATR